MAAQPAGGGQPRRRVSVAVVVRSETLRTLAPSGVTVMEEPPRGFRSGLGAMWPSLAARTVRAAGWGTAGVPG